MVCAWAWWALWDVMLKGNNKEDGLAVVALPYQPGCLCHFAHNHPSLSAIIRKVIMQAVTPRGPSEIKTPFILLASKHLTHFAAVWKLVISVTISWEGRSFLKCSVSTCRAAFSAGAGKQVDIAAARASSSRTKLPALLWMCRALDGSHVWAWGVLF